MAKDFKDFIQYYLNNKDNKIVNTKDGTMPFNFSNQDSFLKSIESLEDEMLKTNINLLYAYHNWMQSDK